MGKNINQNFMDFLEAMNEAFRYVERGVDFFCVKVGSVEIKMDATARKDLKDDGKGTVG